jgi:hypothetical protein
LIDDRDSLWDSDVMSGLPAIKPHPGSDHGVDSSPHLSHRVPNQEARIRSDSHGVYLKIASVQIGLDLITRKLACGT